MANLGLGCVFSIDFPLLVNREPTSKLGHDRASPRLLGCFFESLQVVRLLEVNIGTASPIQVEKLPRTVVERVHVN